MLAEPSLTEFARRVGDDLPEQKVVSFSPRLPRQNSNTATERAVLGKDADDSEWGLIMNGVDTWATEPEPTSRKESAELTMSNHYWSEILSLFGDRLM